MKSIIRISMILFVATAIGTWSLDCKNTAASSTYALKLIPVTAVHHALQGRPKIHIKDGTAANWAGYAVETSLGSPQSGVVSDVKGTWIVPAVKASTSKYTYSSTWIGIDGSSDGTVEQIGTEQDWSNGRPVYYAWFEMYPRYAYEILNFPVNPGDTISAEVQYVGRSTYLLTIKNVTKNATFSLYQSLQSAQRSSAEWIVEAPWSGSVLPLANFGMQSFNNCSATLNGQIGSISDSAWQNDPITMETSNGTTKAKPSSLSNNGANFSVTWYHE